MASLWHETASLPSFPSLSSDTKTGVLVIGGGIAGILTAYFLKEKNIPYMLVEKGKICQWTTGNTTAKITAQHGLVYSKLLKSKGTEKTKGFLLANEIAVEKYGELCRNIDCDFETKDNFVYSVNNRRIIEEEKAALDIIGAEAFFTESIPLPFSAEGAVGFKNQGQFHPLKFISHIAKGMNIYENTFVKEYRDNCVITDKGRISADKIIVTTHFPFINNHGLFSLKLYQHRSYVLALENAPDVNGMYLDERQNGLSFRNYGEFLLMGGGDHRTGKKGGGYNELRLLKEKYFPEAKERYAWAAQDCMSLDGMPYIGQYTAKKQNLYLASGFNKWGMTGAMVSAMILSEMVQGKKSDIYEIFSPSRSILTPQLFLNTFETAISFMTPTVRRCPHLGCALKYNKQEHSWDCACHGSRFDENGSVLDGPANAK